jgi:hypothetical protein
MKTKEAEEDLEHCLRSLGFRADGKLLQVQETGNGKIRSG